MLEDGQATVWRSISRQRLFRPDWPEDRCSESGAVSPEKKEGWQISPSPNLPFRWILGVLWRTRGPQGDNPGRFSGLFRRNSCFHSCHTSLSHELYERQPGRATCFLGLCQRKGRLDCLATGQGGRSGWRCPPDSEKLCFRAYLKMPPGGKELQEGLLHLQGIHRLFENRRRPEFRTFVTICKDWTSAE